MKRILKPTIQVVVSAALVILFSAIGGNIAAKDCSDDGLTCLGEWLFGAIWGYVIGLVAGILVTGKMLGTKTPLWLSVGILGIGIAVIIITCVIYELFWLVIYFAIIPPAIIVFSFYLLRFSFRQLKTLLSEQ